MASTLQIIIELSLIPLVGYLVYGSFRACIRDCKEIFDKMKGDK